MVTKKRQLAKLIVISCLLLLVAKTNANATINFDPSMEYLDEPMVRGFALTGEVIALIPALVIAYPIGSLGYLVGLPFGKQSEYSRKLTNPIIEGVITTGGIITGTPVYIVKKVLYDFPHKLLSPKENEANATPPPHTFVQQSTGSIKPLSLETKEQIRKNRAIRQEAIKKGMAPPMGGGAEFNAENFQTKSD